MIGKQFSKIDHHVTRRIANALEKAAKGVCIYRLNGRDDFLFFKRRDNASFIQV